jgi:hypothetical protein
MNTLIFVLAFCIVAVLVYMARYSGRLRVAQVHTIAAPLAEVHAHIANLALWRPWNPWLEHEPDAPVTVAGPAGAAGQSAHWDGPRTGMGRITNMRVQAPDQVEQRLDFAQPFRFRGRARWRLKALEGGRTEVQWTLKGRVGFTMRAFAKTVQGMVALDFRHGLNRLAQTLEAAPGPACSIDYLGQREVVATRCAHVLYRGPLANLATSVPPAIAKVRQQLAAAGLPSGGDALAIYVKTNVKLRSTECRIGVEIGDDDVGPLAVHKIPAHRAYVVRLQGPASALEMAWYQAMQRLRIENLEPDLRIAPFERYLTPADPTSGQWPITELHLALKPGQA